MEKGIFAAGCFWGVEARFRAAPGVVNTGVGYTGGTLPDPTYEAVCRGDTGHAEAVEVTYDPAVTSYQALLELFWELHDPTTRNRQGPDVGHQYRSAVFYTDASQQAAAIARKNELDASGRFAAPIVTEIASAQTFYPAEEYHQRYFEKQGVDACPL